MRILEQHDLGDLVERGAVGQRQGGVGGVSRGGGVSALQLVAAGLVRGRRVRPEDQPTHSL